MSDHPLEEVFRPRSVALYGISRNMQNRSNQFFLRGLLDQGFHEAAPLYLVNPNAAEIAGIRCYPSLADCPDPVDYVISLVPAPAAEGLIEECIAKGVRGLHLYTGGFAENLDPERAALEQALIGKARGGGLRVIGPNCMGLYHPAARMAFIPGHPREAGDVTVVCQSGGNAMDIISGLAQRGARFAKVVSFGNGTDIGAAELLHYAAEDPETRIVLAYVEDTRDGRALYEALRVCARAKPTIVLKGGISAAGARAARSHTASLAGSHEVFTAASRQAGAAVVRSLDEMIDLAVAVSTRLRAVAGPRAVLLAVGGGYSVLTTDALAECGIDLPELDGATLAAPARGGPDRRQQHREPDRHRLHRRRRRGCAARGDGRGRAGREHGLRDHGAARAEHTHRGATARYRGARGAAGADGHAARHRGAAGCRADSGGGAAARLRSRRGRLRESAERGARGRAVAAMAAGPRGPAASVVAPRAGARLLWGAAPPTPPSRPEHALRAALARPPALGFSFLWGLRPHAPTRIGRRGTASRASARLLWGLRPHAPVRSAARPQPEG